MEINRAPVRRSRNIAKRDRAENIKKKAIVDIDDIRKREETERVGFEPTVRFLIRTLSKRVLSTTQASLQWYTRPESNRQPTA